MVPSHLAGRVQMTITSPFIYALPQSNARQMKVPWRQDICKFWGHNNIFPQNTEASQNLSARSLTIHTVPPEVQWKQRGGLDLWLSTQHSHWHQQEPVAILWDLWAFSALKWVCEDVRLRCPPPCGLFTQYTLGGVLGGSCSGVLYFSPYLQMRSEIRKSCHTMKEGSSRAWLPSQPAPRSWEFPFLSSSRAQGKVFPILLSSPDPSSLSSVPAVVTELNALQHQSLSLMHSSTEGWGEVLRWDCINVTADKQGSFSHFCLLYKGLILHILVWREKGKAVSVL